MIRTLFSVEEATSYRVRYQANIPEMPVTTSTPKETRQGQQWFVKNRSQLTDPSNELATLLWIAKALWRSALEV